MKAYFEKVSISERNTLLVKHVRLPRFDAPWHYHLEYELTYIARSSGKRFVGDHIENFQPGDLVLMGPYLPHLWRNDPPSPDEPLGTEAVVVQFPALLVDTVLSALPEAEPVRQLLVRSRYGLRFTLATANVVAESMLRLTQQSGLTQVLTFLSVLNTLAYDPDTQLLASDSFQLSATEAETERMKRVIEHVLAHFQDDIRIEQIASVAGMAPAAFCRYFRRRTGKSFVEYLNELRISHARKLLAQADLSVGQVGLECGFNNISHFHRQFKLQTGTTPLKYQVMHRHKHVATVPPPEEFV